MSDLREAAMVVAEHCMGIRHGEPVLVVTDTGAVEVAEALQAAARQVGGETMLMVMEPRQNHGEEPPAAVAAAMAAARVVLAPTSKSLSHTRARKDANRAGARVASMPGITPAMMQRSLRAHPGEMAAWCEQYARLLTEAREVHITAPGGTDLTFSIEGRTAHPDTGLLREPGRFGNLPAGEAYIAPVEKTASGILVIDASMSAIGLVDEPLRIRVEGGLAIAVEGGISANKLNAVLERYGPAARNIAELGIGLNPNAAITGLPLEDEKVLGTAHIALGDNSTFGGTVEVASHLDGIFRNPTIRLDGRVVMEHGRMVLN